MYQTEFEWLWCLEYSPLYLVAIGWNALSCLFPEKSASTHTVPPYHSLEVTCVTLWNSQIYSIKLLEAWALRTDVLEMSPDFSSLVANCLWKWPTQSRWYLAPNEIISPSDSFPIKVLPPILWAHDFTLASKPRVDALVSFSAVPCSQRKHMSPGSVDKLLAFGSVHQSTGSSWIDWTWWCQRWSTLFCHLRALSTSCFSAELWQNSCHATHQTWA